MCHRNSGLVIADELGLDPDSQRVGVTTARPPHNPTSFSLLAARGYEPVKRTSIHHWHAEHGGKMLWAGDWKRPYDYGEAEDEAAAVHESLGLIDVSTLGKLIVRGPEAAAFLERIYPNRFGDMKLARVRYGIVCGDDGSIIDDGTVARLSEHGVLRHHHLVRRRRHGAVVHVVERRLGDGLPDRQRHLDDRRVQPGRAERADGAGQLTDFDLSNEAFPYLGAGHAQIAGVPCLILRIGFVGELGYEIHCPPRAGEHLWEELMEAGEESVKPFGLEPQRVLRLEKMHMIIGQDTNAESQAARGGDALDRQARQGERLDRALLDRVVQAPRRPLHAGRLGGPERRCRRRARRWSAPTGAGRPHHLLPLLAPAGQVDRHRLGAGRAVRGGDADPDLRSRRRRRSRPGSRTRPSTTPTERGCGRERRAIPSRSCRPRPPTAPRCERRWSAATSRRARRSRSATAGGWPSTRPTASGRPGWPTSRTIGKIDVRGPSAGSTS